MGDLSCVSWCCILSCVLWTLSTSALAGISKHSRSGEAVRQDIPSLSYRLPLLLWHTYRDPSSARPPPHLTFLIALFSATQFPILIFLLTSSIHKVSTMVPALNSSDFDFVYVYYFQSHSLSSFTHLLAAPFPLVLSLD